MQWILFERAGKGIIRERTRCSKVRRKRVGRFKHEGRILNQDAPFGLQND